MNNRYIGALFLSPLIVFLFLGGIYLKLFVILLSLLGLYEYYKVVKLRGINPFSSIGYIACILYYMLIGSNINYQVLVFLIVAMTFIVLCVPVLDPRYNFIDAAVTLLGFIYVPVFFSFIVLVNAKKSGNYLIWLVFIASWLCDTTAYYVGRYLGKNKLCPKVSPKKTIEGSIGGLIGSTLACGIYGIIVNKYGINIPMYNYFVVGALCGVFCQFGDLVASSIKRFVDVKDYSNLIPGHGGILDRFDSILFAAVIVFYYLSFIAGI